MTSGRRKTQRVKTARKNSKRIMKSYRRRRSVRKYKTVKHGGMGLKGNIQRLIGSKSGSAFKDDDTMGTLISKTTEYNKLKNTTPQPPQFQAMRESLAALLKHYAGIPINVYTEDMDEQQQAERKTYVYNIDKSVTIDALKSIAKPEDLDYQIVVTDTAAAAAAASAAAASGAAGVAGASAGDDFLFTDEEFAAEIESYEDALRNANSK
jgi:hypothetical protein